MDGHKMVTKGEMKTINENKISNIIIIIITKSFH